MARLAVARLWFCSNSFTPRRTRGEDVQAHEWAIGQAAVSSDSDSDSELAGVLAFAAERPDWDVTFLRCASAPPGGPLSAELFGSWMAEVEDALRWGRFDAVYLSLHGACQAEGDPSADITILRRVRSIIGHKPVVATFDPRANLSEEVAILLDGACGNQKWPNGGGADAAIRALTLLEGILAGTSRPVGVLARVPLVMGAMDMGKVLAPLWLGKSLAHRKPILDASVFGGFAWGDSPYAGPSALVWADRDAGAARELAAALALDLARASARPFTGLVLAETAIKSARSASGGKPVLLLDPSDDPAIGGLADTPGLLRALLAAEQSGILTGRVALAALHDPEAVTAAAEASPGAHINITLAGRGSAMFGKGIAVTALVLAAHAPETSAGFAVLRVGMVDIVVTTARHGIVTPAWIAARGVCLGSLVALAVKGGGETRVAFAGAVADAVLCDCPGPTNPDLLCLPFHYVPAVRRGGPADLWQPGTNALAFSAAQGAVGSARLSEASPDQANQRDEDCRANAQ